MELLDNAIVCFHMPSSVMDGFSPQSGMSSQLVGCIVFLKLGQTNLISGSTDFFQNLKGRSVGKKRKIRKKIPNFLH